MSFKIATTGKIIFAIVFFGNRVKALDFVLKSGDSKLDKGLGESKCSFEFGSSIFPNHSTPAGLVDDNYVVPFIPQFYTDDEGVKSPNRDKFYPKLI